MSWVGADGVDRGCSGLPRDRASRLGAPLDRGPCCQPRHLPHPTLFLQPGQSTHCNELPLGQIGQPWKNGGRPAPFTGRTGDDSAPLAPGRVALAAWVSTGKGPMPLGQRVPVFPILSSGLSFPVGQPIKPARSAGWPWGSGVVCAAAGRRGALSLLATVKRVTTTGLGPVSSPPAEAL